MSVSNEQIVSKNKWEDGAKSDAKGDLSQLRKFPHLLEKIFTALSYKSILEAEKVSPLWEEMLSRSNVWEKLWRHSPTREILATRLQYLQPELFERVVKGDVRPAVKYVEENIEQILDLSIKSHCSIKSSGWNVFKMRVNAKHVYIATYEKIIIVHRWTKQLIKEMSSIVESHYCIYDIQLTKLYFVVKLYDGLILIYNLETYELVQTFNDRIDGRSPAHKFGIGGNILVNLQSSEDKRYLFINFRRFNPSTNKFNTWVEKRIRARFMSQINPYDVEIYFDGKYAIIDVYCKDLSGNPSRVIIAVSLNLMEVVGKRRFPRMTENHDIIKRECHNSIILVENTSADGAFLAAWNLEKNTVEPVHNPYSIIREGRIIFSAAMSCNPSCQFILYISDDDNVNMNVFSVEGRGHGKNSFEVNNSCERLPILLPLNNQRVTYFDGLQLIIHREVKLTFIEFIG